MQCEGNQDEQNHIQDWNAGKRPANSVVHTSLGELVVEILQIPVSATVQKLIEVASYYRVSTELKLSHSLKLTKWIIQKY